VIDDTREHFEADTKDHGLTILFDNGLYRHLRLAKPGTRIAQFDIVTWPGFLAFTGDMGDYVFARLDDMLEFFRGHAPNHSYWAEKCVAADKDSGIRAYDPAQARAAIEETVAEFLNDAWDLREDARSILQRDVEDHVLSCLDEGSTPPMKRFTDLSRRAQAGPRSRALGSGTSRATPTASNGRAGRSRGPSRSTTRPRRQRRPRRARRRSG
jgi:hypothetical protein